MGAQSRRGVLRHASRGSLAPAIAPAIASAITQVIAPAIAHVIAPAISPFITQPSPQLSPKLTRVAAGPALQLRLQPFARSPTHDSATVPAVPTPALPGFPGLADTHRAADWANEDWERVGLPAPVRLLHPGRRQRPLQQPLALRAPLDESLAEAHSTSRRKAAAEVPRAPTMHAPLHFSLALQHARSVRAGDELIGPSLFASPALGLFHLTTAGERGDIA